MHTELKQTKWRNSFFFLLLLNILIFGMIGYGLLAPVPKQETVKEVIPPKTETAKFTVSTTTEDVSDMVNAYLAELLAEENYQYTIVLQENVQIRGNLPIFGASVPLLIVLEPHVLENGNLLLKQKSLSLGKFSLPNQQAMKYVTSLLEIPEWVVVKPDQEEIVIQLTEMTTKSNLRLAIERFDLQTNDIIMKVSMPLDSAKGIETNE